MPVSDDTATRAEEPQGEPGVHENGGDTASDDGTDANAVTPFESSSYVENLPDDILLLVLGWLDIKTRILIERVCHRWKDLARRLWKAQGKLSFAGVFSISQGKPLTITIFRALLNRCGESLRHLDLATASHRLDHKAVKAIGSRCPNLEYLDVSGVELSNASVQQLANRCPKLKTVLFKDCRGVREKSIRRLLWRCKHLEHFDMTEMFEFTGECFDINGLQLRRLTMRSCSGLTSKGVASIAAKCTSLVEFKLFNCFTIKDQDLQSICQHMKTLKSLGLVGSLYHATSNAIGGIGKLRLLESLDLSTNQTVNDAAIAAISSGCTKLRFLNISNCHKDITDAAMSHVARLRELRELKLSYIDKITDAGMYNLGCHGLLQSVEVRGCVHLTDAGVQALVELCRDLRTFDLSGCDQLSIAALEVCAAMVADRPHVLTMVVGGTSVEHREISTDSNGKLKIDFNDYCMEPYLAGEMDLDYEDYWDQELYDYEAGYDYWDASDYEDDYELMGDLWGPGGVFINVWEGADLDDGDEEGFFDNYLEDVSEEEVPPEEQFFRDDAEAENAENCAEEDPSKEEVPPEGVPLEEQFPPEEEYLPEEEYPPEEDYFPVEEYPPEEDYLAEDEFAADEFSAW